MKELEAVPGVGPGTAKELKKIFVTTVELLAVQNPVELQEKTRLGEGTAAKIVRNARQLAGMSGFQSGIEFEKKMAAKKRLTFGIKAIDTGLLGGIEEGSIVEIYGAARGGKTQWSSHLAVRAQLPEEEGGLGGRVLWMDSESSFKPWVIRSIAIRFGLDPEVALGNIGISQMILSSQIADTFETIPDLCARDGYRLVVIDSFSGLFRAEYTKLNDLSVRQKDMNSLLNSMRRAGTATGAIFIYTNQVLSNIRNFGFAGPGPIGGHILAHGCDYRFYTRLGKKAERKISLKDNAGVPEFDATAMLGWGGFYEKKEQLAAGEKKIKDFIKKKGWNARLMPDGTVVEDGGQEDEKE